MPGWFKYLSWSAASAWGVAVLLDAGLKGVAILTLSILAALAMRRASAAARHLVWSLAMLALILLPLFSAVLPAWRVLPRWLAPVASEPEVRQTTAFVPPVAEATNSSEASSQFQTSSQQLPPPAQNVEVQAPVATPVPTSTRTEPASHWTWRECVMLVWLGGAFIVFARVLLGIFSLWRLQRKSDHLREPGWIARLQTAREKLRMRQSVELLRSRENVMPMTWGIFRPKLLLPRDCDTWSAERMRVVLLHELAHVKRHDCLTHMLMQLACVLHWFNPLMRLASRRIIIERERACDDLVLSAGSKPSDYAEHLMHIAAGLKIQSGTAAAAIAMARPSTLEGRLLAILDQGRTRGALTKISIVLAIAIAIGAVLPISAMRARTLAAANEKVSESQPAQATLPVRLYVTGRVASKPGVYEITPAETTLGGVLELAGINETQLDGIERIAHLITLDPADSTTGHTEELGAMLRRLSAFKDRKLNSWMDSRSEWHMILWTGTPLEWKRFNNSTRDSTVIAGAGKAAEEQAASERAKGNAVKIVDPIAPSYWPAQYDELMRLAEEAGRIKRWPGGESWLSQAKDEDAIRQVIAHFLDAAEKGDESAVAKCYRGTLAASAIKDLRKSKSAGVKAGEIRSVTIAPDHALVVTEFSQLSDRKYKNPVCMVYTLALNANRWVITDIDLEDAEGLIAEVRRFDDRYGRKAVNVTSATTPADRSDSAEAEIRLISHEKNENRFDWHVTRNKPVRFVSAWCVMVDGDEPRSEGGGILMQAPPATESLDLRGTVEFKRDRVQFNMRLTETNEPFGALVSAETNVPGLEGDVQLVPNTHLGQLTGKFQPLWAARITRDGLSKTVVHVARAASKDEENAGLIVPDPLKDAQLNESIQALLQPVTNRDAPTLEFVSAEESPEGGSLHWRVQHRHPIRFQTAWYTVIDGKINEHGGGGSSLPVDGMIELRLKLEPKDGKIGLLLDRTELEPDGSKTVGRNIKTELPLNASMRMLYTREPLQLGEEPRPFWQAQWWRDGKLVKTLAYSARVVGQGESEPLPVPLPPVTVDVVQAVTQPANANDAQSGYASLTIRYDIPQAAAEGEFILEKQGGLIVPPRTIMVRNGGEATVKKLVPGSYHFYRKKQVFPSGSDMGTQGWFERQWFTLEANETKIIEAVRKEGQPLEGELRDLPMAQISAAFVSIMPAAAEGLPESELFRLPVLDRVAADPDGTWKTDIIPPGDYLVMVEAHKPRPPELRNVTGIIPPAYTGTAKVTVPKQARPPRVRINMQSATTRPAATKPAASRHLDLRVVRGDTSEPLAGADVEIRLDAKREKKTTDEQGRLQIEFGDKIPEYLVIIVTKDSYAGMRTFWDKYHYALGIPPTFTIPLEPGTSIGGIIQDEAGRPIADAKLTLSLSNPSVNVGHALFPALADQGIVNTDASGRWLCNVLPLAFNRIDILLSHPDYISDEQYGQRAVPPIGNLRDQSAVMVMKKGLSITGTVRNGKGEPVANASVSRNPNHRVKSWYEDTTTNAEGKFEFKNVRSGQLVLTVQAKGYSPSLTIVEVEKQPEPFQIQLEPGHTIRARVVDIKGQPVQGVWVWSRHWKGYATFMHKAETDAEGRFSITDAPADEVLFEMGKDGYIHIWDQPLKAGAETVLTMKPVLRVHGSVSDAKTGEPIRMFQMVPGYGANGQTHWARGNAKTFPGSEYESIFDFPRDSYVVRIEAKGYAPAVSPTYTGSEGEPVYDFKLEKSGESGEKEVISGTVTDMSGKPVPGAKVALSIRPRNVYVQNGNILANQSYPSALTESDGTFQISPQDNVTAIVVLADAGYAVLKKDQISSPAAIQLQPWGRIEGTMKIGARPAVNERSYLIVDGSDDERGMLLDYKAGTDGLGRFSMERVPAGSYRIGREVVFNQTARGNMSSFTNPVSIEVKSGETTQVTIGGMGRPVIGRVEASESINRTFDWTWGYHTLRGRPDAGYPIKIQSDGSFRIDDVAEGTYELSLSVQERSANFVIDQNAVVIAQLTKTIVVPEIPGGRSDEPLDLGVLTLNAPSENQPPPASRPASRPSSRDPIMPGNPASRPARASGSGGPAGRVILSDGTPLKEALVILVRPAEPGFAYAAQFLNGQIADARGSLVIETGADGKFSFPPQDAPYHLVVLHEDGCADATLKELESDPDVRLRPWGKVEGTLHISNTEVANQKILLQREIQDAANIRILFKYDARSDENGGFVFDRVCAGEAMVGREVEQYREKSGVTYFDHGTAVDIKLAETAKVTIGGSGHAVTGRITQPEGSSIRFGETFIQGTMSRAYIQPVLPPDFATMGSEQRAAWYEKWLQSKEAKAQRVAESTHYMVPVGGDGSFRVEDVPAGDYRLMIQVNKLHLGPDWGLGETLGYASLEFTVTQADAEHRTEPHDLGVMKMRRPERPRPATTRPSAVSQPSR